MNNSASSVFTPCQRRKRQFPSKASNRETNGNGYVRHSPTVFAHCRKIVGSRLLPARPHSCSPSGRMRQVEAAARPRPLRPARTVKSWSKKWLSPLNARGSPAPRGGPRSGMAASFERSAHERPGPEGTGISAQRKTRAQIRARAGYCYRTVQSGAYAARTCSRNF